jgi:hypothetical protein
MTRPSLAHLVTVTLGVWVFLVVRDLEQGGDLVHAPLAAASGVLRFGLVALALVVLLLVPAMVLTVELVHRIGATSRTARSVVGASSWAGWCLFVAVALAVGSRMVVGPETLAGDLVLFAAAGAGFSLLGFTGRESRPGKAFALLALAVTAFVILGSIWMAGRWGGTA